MVQASGLQDHEANKKAGETPAPQQESEKTLIIRDDFPALAARPNEKRLVYLDSASTSHKPRAVIDAVSSFYLNSNAKVHRSVHDLSERATRAYEGARAKVQRFIHAAEAREIVFVRSATEAINAVAFTYGKAHVSPGDEVLITASEHHSNIVPWQRLCADVEASLLIAPISPRGELLLDALEKLLTPRTRLVAVAHVSNAIGTVNPIGRIIEMSHRRGIPVLVDGAQALPHVKVDVKDLDCDFYAFSGHKLYAPTGIGVLYGKAALLESMPPFQGGGDMIQSVSFETTTYAGIPQKFEAGTPNTEGAVGLGAATDYVSAIGIEAIEEHERDLLAYAQGSLSEVGGLRILGSPREARSVLAFVVDGIHPHDLATILDRENIAVRAGHLCAQPLMDFFDIPAATRVSLAIYNTREDIDLLVAGVKKAREMF